MRYRILEIIENNKKKYRPQYNSVIWFNFIESNLEGYINIIQFKKLKDAIKYINQKKEEKKEAVINVVYTD